MLFVRHASTPGMRAARFPLAEEDADAASLTRAAALAPVVAGPVAWSAPGAAARRTAAAIGGEARVVPALAEADHGRWRGLPYERVAREEPDALARWLADPHAAPHGGESLAAHAERVAGWLESVRAEPGVVVCDAGTIRAALGHALGLDPLRAARFDLAPLSVTELSAVRGGWRVTHVNRVAPVNRKVLS
ncbi:histidine phosphatase family protein [Nonomuraea sp. SMC257]|uniref:Histidine phosphatase family protein n=1 Tax=Nonomuraea montanisoli TaxID=2741721 RepID=A0A7Y6M4D9_9ACTN|nr:histidine phosphatase family protein [Nonomuraea montanisoli]NUW34698.1 histidine phosphatase family protein [Nonomuraea montanisoli]